MSSGRRTLGQRGNNANAVQPIENLTPTYSSSAQGMNQVFRQPSTVARTHGLFLNTTKAQCSIYQSGRMVYENIRHLQEFALDYIELNEIDAASFNATAVLRNPDGTALKPVDGDKSYYDFIVFNYHPHTMAPYLSAATIRQLPVKCFSVVLEIDPGNAYAQIPTDVFDGLIVLDPTIGGDERVWPFPRPLEGEPRRPVPSMTQTPRIGSFGFGTPGKGFDLLVSAVNLEFQAAVIRINIPPSSYADDVMKSMYRRNYGEYLGDLCRRIAKPGITVQVTHDFMSETELVDWCEDNDINCFMYTRRQSGLSATTDQAIISGRPLLISANDTFRHIHPYIRPYPRNTIREALATSVTAVRQMQQDWSVQAFGQQFLSMLRGFDVLSRGDATAIADISTTPKSRRLRILVAARRHPMDRTILCWEERVLQALRTSVVAEVVEAVTFDHLSDIEAIIFWSGCNCVLILDENADPEIKADEERLGPNRRYRTILACRQTTTPAHNQPSHSSWLELGPIIPFYTSLQKLPEGRPVIGCYGFETSRSNLSDIVAKAQREMGEADIRLHLLGHLPTEAMALLERRLSLLRTQLLPTGGVTVTVIGPSQDPSELISGLAQHTVNIFSSATFCTSALANLLDLAMAVDRPVCQTAAAPVHGYAEILPNLEAGSLPELTANGVARQAATYNAFSEGRVLLALEDALAVGTDKSKSAQPAISTLKPTRHPASVLRVEPNGIIGPDWQNGLGTAILHIKTKEKTVDETYRSGTLAQQGYLLRAIQALHPVANSNQLLLIGDVDRKSAVVLGELGYRFDHMHVAQSLGEDHSRYTTVASLNAVSGRDELMEMINFAEAVLMPGGYVILTFFFGESYNNRESDGNLDFPLLTAADLQWTIDEIGARMELVTTPRWQSDRPELTIKPFDLPPYGSLTLRKPATREKA